jgi:hypothetical protein
MSDRELWVSIERRAAPLEVAGEPRGATGGKVTMTTRMLNGQCFCGAVNFEAEDDLAYAFYCHCSRCRRRSGAACSALGGIAADKLRVTRGAEHVLRVGASERGYLCVCKECHASLFASVREGRFVHIPLGTLSEAPTRAPDHHIFVGSKAAWHAITDGLPQYSELPP